MPPDGSLSRRPIVGAIVVGAILLIGTGMALELAHLQFWMYLSLLILWLPVVFMIASRIHKPPVRTERMTGLEVATAAVTLIVGAILLAYVAQGGGSFALMIFGFLAIPAALITLVRARNRRYTGRAMTGLQLAASIMFLAVLLPVLVLTSLAIALYLVCLASGQFR